MKKTTILRIFALLLLAFSLYGLVACQFGLPGGPVSSSASTPAASSSIHPEGSSAITASSSQETQGSIPSVSQDTVATNPENSQSSTPIPTDSTAGTAVIPTVSQTGGSTGVIPTASQSTGSRPIPTSTQSTARPPIPTTTQSTARPPIPTTTQSTASTPIPTVTQTVTTAPAPTTEPFRPVGNIVMPGLEQLRAQGNPALEAAYFAIAAGVEDCLESIPLSNITTSDLGLVYDCYYNDFPNHFWLGNQYGWISSGNQVVSFEPTYSMSPSEAESAKAVFEATVDGILAQLHGGMSDYDKALTLHDAIIDRCTYGKAANAHNAYGALVDGVAVCEGYAEAYQYLLYRADIPCILVSGWAGEAHAWNAVKMDGSWYYTDVTWDDPKGGDGTIHYGYFGLTRAMMDQDHTADPSHIPLPAANSLDCNYYARNGGLMEHFDLDQMTALLKKAPTIRVYVTGDVDAFMTAFEKNWQTVMINADAHYSSVSWSTGSREIIITYH